MLSSTKVVDDPKCHQTWLSLTLFVASSSMSAVVVDIDKEANDQVVPLHLHPLIVVVSTQIIHDIKRWSQAC